jgi:putative ABC transport system permease protein
LVSRNTGLWIFGLRNLIRRPIRTILTLIGLSVPVLGVLGLFSLSSGIRNLLDDTLAQVQGILVLRENAPIDLFSELPAGMAETLSTVPGVRVVAPQVWKIAPAIEGRSLIPRSAARVHGDSRQLTLQGLLDHLEIEGQDVAAHARLHRDVYRSKLLPPNRGGGRFLDPRDIAQPHIVISTKIARDFPGPRGDPRAVGDQLRIGGQLFTIIGIYETGSLFLDGIIVMDMTTCRRLLNLNDHTVSCFLVEPADLARTDEVADAIKRAIPGVDARTMSEFRIGVGQFLSQLDLLLLIVISLALVVGSVGILNTMLMSTSERLAEFGILRTNGWSRGELLRLVLCESVSLGLLAGILGCLLALVALIALNPLLEGGVRLIMSGRLLLLGLGLAIVLGTLGGLYPAWRVSRLAPMESIRKGSR